MKVLEPARSGHGQEDKPSHRARCQRRFPQPLKLAVGPSAAEPALSTRRRLPEPINRDRLHASALEWALALVKTEFANLGEVREKLVAMSHDFVARSTGIPATRLTAIETDAVPTLNEVDRLAQLYGVDAEILEELPIRLEPGDAIACLARAPEYREIGDVIRSRIIGAANAARDLVMLERLAGYEQPRWEQLNASAPRFKKNRDRDKPPFRQGARLASQLRKHLGIGDEPIASMRGFVERHFASIVVLYARLGTHGPAGLAFVDRVRGPTIVLNHEGKNTNACVRRVSLAHELCHVLVDWSRQEPMATISGYLKDETFETEQRANAFAIRLLCPEPALFVDTDAAGSADRDAAIRRLSGYGLPYTALRLYLKNNLNDDVLGPGPSSHDLAKLNYSRWIAAEEESDLDRFPLTEVPLERRTAVARLAAETFCRGLLTRAAFARYLGVSPLCEVEKVVDFYGLDAP